MISPPCICARDTTPRRALVTIDPNCSVHGDGSKWMASIRRRRRYLAALGRTNERVTKAKG